MQRCPGRTVKEIQPGFYTDTHHTNYVWIVLLEPTGDPLANTHTTVDSTDIQAWHERRRSAGLGDFSIE